MKWREEPRQLPRQEAPQSAATIAGHNPLRLGRAGEMTAGCAQLQNYPIAASPSPLRERDVLRRAATHHILDLNGIGRDVYYLVAAVHNVAFARNENILALGEKDFPGLAGLIRETEEFERNRRRWRRLGRDIDFRRRVGLAWCPRLRDYRIRLRHKNVPSRTCVFYLLSSGQHLQLQCRVQVLHRRPSLFALTRTAVLGGGARDNNWGLVLNRERSCRRTRKRLDDFLARGEDSQDS